MKKLILFLSIFIIVFTMPAFAAEFSVQVNSSESSINFRTAPSRSSSVMMEIPDGTVLNISALIYDGADNLIFGQTVYNGISGWVSLRQTTIVNFNGFEAVVNSTEGSINFRASASTGSGVLTEIPNGTALHISDMFYNAGDDLFFGMTTYNGITGWVSLRQTVMSVFSSSPSNTYVSSVPVNNAYQGQQQQSSVRTDVGFNGKVTVKSEEGSINFRTEPSTSSGIICEIPHNTVLTIEDVVSNEGLIWGYTQYNGTKGWVSLRHTATPFHTYSMPEYIREWEGSQQTSYESVTEEPVPADVSGQYRQSLVGNWEYNSYDETPNAYYHAGYCFYEDGTGLDTFWDQHFTYSTDGCIVTIVFDDPEYGTEHFAYSFGETFSGNPQYAQYGIWLEYMIEDEQGNLQGEERTGSNGNGLRRLHFADLSEERKAAVSIKEGKCKSWDNMWYITTEDGTTVTIENIDGHYNYGNDRQQIIPEKINGHRVTKIGDNALNSDQQNSLVIPEGIESIGNEAFRNCRYTSVSFPASVQYIGSDIFADCKDLQVIYAPAGSYAAQYFQAAGMYVELY